MKTPYRIKQYHHGEKFTDEQKQIHKISRRKYYLKLKQNGFINTSKIEERKIENDIEWKIELIKRILNIEL